MTRPRSPFVFVHVEKAGGITIHNMLHHFVNGYITPKPDYGPYFESTHLEKVQKLYPSKIIGVGGHRINPINTYFQNQYQFSFVREPISRYLSHLNWQISMMEIDWDLESFMSDSYFNNFQTFRLTGTRDLKRAKNIILRNFDFIGIMEDFSNSVGIVSNDLFGDLNYLSYEKMNKTKETNKKYTIDEISDQLKSNIIALNSVDIEIYNWIKAQYFDRLSQLKIEKISNSNLFSPGKSKLKRKLSNLYIGRFIQPSIQQKVEHGY